MTQDIKQLIFFFIWAFSFGIVNAILDIGFNIKILQVYSFVGVIAGGVFVIGWKKVNRQ